LTGRELIQVGVISGVHGIKGWVKIFSFTEPKENILTYTNWLLEKNGQQKPVSINESQIHGKGIIAQFEDVSDRDQAQLYVGNAILVSREQLPKTEKGEYYWADLIGLDVESLEGFNLGKIVNLFQTGANDVVVINGERERALPFIQGDVIKSIDLEAKKMIVDWDKDF
jgi:16S rRNA processing protein RimM